MSDIHEIPRDVHDMGVRTPVTHSVQSALPTTELLYLPSAQAEHATDPATAFVDVPSGHAAQLDDPTSDVNPAAQFVHNPRVTLAYLPAAQDVHDERPDWPRVLVPGGQIAHRASP